MGVATSYFMSSIAEDFHKQHNLNETYSNYSKHAREGIWSQNALKLSGQEKAHLRRKLNSTKPQNLIQSEKFNSEENAPIFKLIEKSKKNKRYEEGETTEITNTDEIEKISNCELSEKEWVNKMSKVEEVSETMLDKVFGMIMDENHSSQGDIKSDSKSTVDMHGIQRKKSGSIRDKTTTSLIGKLRANIKDDFVEFEYFFNRSLDKDTFKASGSIETLLEKLGKFLNSGSDVEKAETKTIFFQNLEFLINKSFGELEWNGAVIVGKDEPNDRIELVAYDMEPTKLYLNVDGLSEIKSERSKSRLEIKAMDSQEKVKWFRMSGAATNAITLGLPSEGKLCLNFPDMES